VMTFSYGVTEGGVRAQIIEAYKEEFGLHEPHPWHVGCLAKMIMAATKEMLRRPNDVMECIRGLAELEAERNLPLKWITPGGLSVINNRCYEPNTKTVELKLKGRRVEYRVADGRKDKINTADAMNDAPANFVHSMDAAHLALAVNAAVEEGITDIAVVHDCYGAAAPQVQRFQQRRSRRGAARDPSRDSRRQSENSRNHESRGQHAEHRCRDEADKKNAYGRVGVTAMAYVADGGKCVGFVLGLFPSESEAAEVVLGKLETRRGLE
jgi:DNA-dependent RNA polymerase